MLVSDVEIDVGSELFKLGVVKFVELVKLLVM